MKTRLKNLALVAFILLISMGGTAKAEPKETISIKIDTIWSIVPSEKNYGHNAAFLQPTKDIDTTYVFFGGKNFFGGYPGPHPNDTTLCQVNNQTGEIIKVIAKVPSPEECLKPEFVFMQDTNYIIGENSYWYSPPDWLERRVSKFNIRTGKNEYIPSRPYNRDGFYIAYIPEDDAILFDVPGDEVMYCKYNLKDKTLIPENYSKLGYIEPITILSPDRKYMVVIASTVEKKNYGYGRWLYWHTIKNHLIDTKDMSIKHKFIDTVYFSEYENHNPKNYVHCIFSPDSRNLILLPSDGFFEDGTKPYLALFDLANNMQKREIRVPVYFQSPSLSFTYDSKFLYMSHKYTTENPDHGRQDHLDQYLYRLADSKTFKINFPIGDLNQWDIIRYDNVLFKNACKLRYTIIENLDSSDVESPSNTLNNASVYIQNSILHINSNKENQLSDISIINLLGAELYQNQEVNTIIPFPYPSGIYFVKIKINNEDKIYKVINY